jgi:ankyrin repeat protein
VNSPAYACLTRNGATFSVIKNRNAKSLVAKVNSENLYYFLLQALPSDAVAHQVSCSYDLNVLLKNYGALESLLCEAEALPDDFYSSVGELGLFVRDFLLDVSIWNSFGLELLYELGILSASHWQDMQSWTAARTLDDLEDILSSESKTGNHEIDIDSTPSPNFRHLDTNKQLWYAAKAGNHHVVHGLLAFKEGPVDLSCLIAALDAGHFEIFWTLFNHGVVDKVQHNIELIGAAASLAFLEGPVDLSRLTAALHAGYFEIFWTLSNHGVVDKVQHNMFELIGTAARCGHLATVRSLVQDRTFKGYRGYPQHKTLRDQLVRITFMHALKEAAGAGHIEIVNYFLSLGADINEWLLGTSPLTSAVENGHLAMVQHLVKIGAKPDDEALLAAVKQNDTSMAEYLLEHGANSIKGVAIATMEKDDRMLQLLLRHGANINNRDCRLERAIFEGTRRVRSQFMIPLVLFAALNTLRTNSQMEEPRRWQMEDPRRCPVLAEIRAKERWAMKQRLRESFLRSHSKFLDRSRQSDASDALAVFANGISLPQSAWKGGINSIRRLLNSRLPSTLLEVFSSIQVSCAMRCALDGVKPPNVCHGKPNISADLDRWRLAVPADEQPLFDEIASFLWDESYQTASHQVDWRYEQEPLEYFQKLMTSLITATQASYIAGDGFNLGGERLNTIQERFVILDQVPCESHDTASLSTIHSFEEPDDLRSRQIPLLDKWKPASPMVILLTATAFFMIVVTFLSGSSTVLNTHFGKRHAKLRW